VSESCTNAIEHAYSPAPASFELKASAHDGEIVIVVKDTGQWRSARGRNRGRGLIITRAAMDDVQINTGAGGSEIVMRKRMSE
jgi:anti-sigma regulatory factor (Ser/Thr protein kinase)